MECLSWVLLFSGARSVCSVWSPLPRGQPCPWHVILSWALLLACCLHCTEMSQGPSDGRSLYFGSLFCEVPSTPKRFLTSRNQVKILVWILVWMYVQVCKKKNSVLNQQLSKSVHFRNWAVLTPPFYFRLLHFWNKAQLVWQMALGIPLP